MALVPDAWVDQWFKPESPIYQNYKYIYKNPVWKKPVPKGASLCPYFWKSCIIGFLFLRCFLIPMLLILGFLLDKCGDRVASYDKRMTQYLIDRFFKDKNASAAEYGGMGALFTLASIAFPIGLGYLGNVLLEFYLVEVHTITDHSVFFWIVLGLPLTVLSFNAKSNYDAESKCKPKNFGWLWISGSVLAILYAASPIIWEGIVWLWEGLCSVSSMVWEWVSSLFSSAASSLNVGMIVAVIACVFVSLYCIGRFLSKDIVVEEDKSKEKEPNNVDPVKLKAVYIRKMVRELNYSSHEYKDMLRKKIGRRYKEIGEREYVKVREFLYIRSMRESIITMMDLDSLPLDKYHGDYKKADDFRDLLWHIPFDKEMMENQNDMYYGMKFVGESNEHANRYTKIYTETIDRYFEDCDEYMKTKMLSEMKSEDKRKEKCEKMTAITNKCLGVARFPFTLLGYCWILIKSRKQGVCPYKSFIEVDEDENCKDPDDEGMDY